MLWIFPDVTWNSIANSYRLFRYKRCFDTSFFSRGVNCSTWLKEQIIFTQNVFLVHVQTRLKVNKIFVQFHCLCMYQNNLVSKWPVSLQTASCTFSPEISIFQSKRLCHGCLIHFVNNVNYTLLMSLVNSKITASCQTSMPLKQYFKRYKQRKWTLKKCKAKKFSKYISVSIFKFVHLFLFLYFVVLFIPSIHALSSYFTFHLVWRQLPFEILLNFMTQLL